eukprot:8935196-Prorocentrum_lima.AAC.1
MELGFLFGTSKRPPPECEDIYAEGDRGARTAQECRGWSPYLPGRFLRQAMVPLLEPVVAQVLFQNS